MAINIDDSLRNRALNILNNEQNELDGSFDRQSVAGKSPGMESEYIKETTFFTREELQVKQNADGTWSQTKKKNKNKYYDEGVVDDKEKEFKENADQKKLLWTVLGINFAFFLIEMTSGLISKSMGLVADSLDMLADSFVYGISLFAVGGTLIKKKRNPKQN